MNPMSKVRQFLFPNDKVRLIEIPIVSKLIQLTDVSNNTKTVAFVGREIFQEETSHYLQYNSNMPIWYHVSILEIQK